MDCCQETICFLKTIADQNRFKILQLISKGEICVCKINEALNLPQNLVSHHLKVLTEAGLVTYRQDKNWKYYSLREEVIKQKMSLAEGDLLYADINIGKAKECG